MSALWTVWRKEMLEAVRSRRLLGVTATLFVFGAASPLLARLTPQILQLLPGAEAFAALVPEPSLADAVAQYLKNQSQFGILLAILTSMGAVVQEKERGTAAMVLCKPLPRWAFIAGKFMAIGASFLLALAVGAVAGYYYSEVLFGGLGLGRWLAANMLLLTWLLVHAAMTLLFSTLGRSQLVAGGGGFGMLAVLGLLGSVPGLQRWLPAALLGWAARLCLGGGGPAWPALVVSLALTFLSLIGACVALERQEI
jgi:ABC-2 type transport system permease protein